MFRITNSDIGCHVPSAETSVSVGGYTVIPPFPSQAVTIRNVEPFGTALTVMWQVAAGSTEEGLVITVRELNSNGDIKITNNYTIPRRDFVQRAKCVGKLMEKTTYEVCIVANITGRTSEEIDCFDSFVRTLEVDTVDVSNCAQPTTIEVGSRLEDSRSSSGGIPDWAIAVIVVGVLAMVALAFCLMGVFFACHTSQRKGGVDFGSQSSIHTESLSSNMHIQNHRPMSPSRSCLSYHSKGHSTNWNDHVDTLRALESGVATAV